MPVALDLLKTKFGYDSFRDNQEEIINTILNRRDALVLMPTGGGKSLCYQIPALLFNGLTVVISPLIALMKDQVDALRMNGIPAAYLNSSLEPWEKQEVMHDLSKNEIKLLYVAPERLFNNAQQFIAFLKSLNVSLFAIDEAHCISHWGHDFRPEYRLLAALKQEFPLVPTIALTATADELTRRDIAEKLKLKNPEVFISSFNRPNIHYTIEPKRDSFGRLRDFLDHHTDDSGIIYVLSRNSTERLANDLALEGFSVKPYHAGLDAETRHRHQELFIKDKVKIIVATIAFGMGINKSNVRFVVHMDLPKNIEGYYQETGRAGRDGLKSDALLFYSPGDVLKLKRFAMIDNNPEQTRIMLHKLSQMADLCEARVCRRKKILNYFGEEAAENCASCDACLTKYDYFDGTVIAQKAISAVARLAGSHGLTYLVDFLRGSKSEKIKDEHKALKTYGIGADIGKDDWFRYIKDLIALGFLQQVGHEYPVIKLTKTSEAVLKGLEQIQLVKSVTKQKTKAGDLPYEKELFLDLKNLRNALAVQEDVPAYIIFSDTTLIELAAYLPTDLTEIRRISGFGDMKTAKYGAQFLQIITDFCQTNNLSSKINLKTPKRERKTKSYARAS